MRTHQKKALVFLLMIYGLTLLVWLFVLGPLDSHGFFTGLKYLLKATLPPLFVAFVFQRWVWRWKPVQVWLKMPNLRGTWEGELISNQDTNVRIPITITIFQTLTSLYVAAKTETSSSLSSCAYLLPHVALPRYDLIFTYLNSPKGENDLDMHWGTSIFAIDGLCPTTLEGSYFTNRQPQTRGSITLKRISRT